MNTINPAWQGLLDKLPPALHQLIIPELESWDKGVQEKFTEIHKEYEDLKPFKHFVENNVTADFAWQSVVFADELQKNPAAVAQQINDNWQLGLVTKDEFDKAVAERTNDPSEDLFENEDGTSVDLSKIPEFQTMQQTLQTLQQTEEEKRKQEELDQAVADFEAELDALEEKVTSENKPFNRKFVTALMAQGVDADSAVKEFHQLMAGTAEVPTETTSTTDAPVTMGNGGTVGGGVDGGEIKWSELSNSDFQANVAKALEAMQTGNSS